MTRTASGGLACPLRPQRSSSPGAAAGGKQPGPGGPLPPSPPGRWAALGAEPAVGLDVLVDVERVVRVVTMLDLGESVVIAAVGGFDAVRAFVHQEIDVGAACRGRVQLLPVVPRPLGEEAGVVWVGVDTDDHTSPAAVAVGEGRRVPGDAAG